MDLSQVTLGAVLPEQEARFRDLMATHHYLGAAPKVGETVWYGALWRGEWVALASFSAAALKCQARDAWIGWTLRHKYDRLHLVANNTRFLLLRPVPNLGSRVLGLCARHLVRDWPARFHHPLVLLETFVDPSRFVGTVYRGAGWTEVVDGCAKAPISGEHKIWGLTSWHDVFSQVGRLAAGSSLPAMNTRCVRTLRRVTRRAGAQRRSRAAA